MLEERLAENSAMIEKLCEVIEELIAALNDESRDECCDEDAVDASDGTIEKKTDESVSDDENDAERIVDGSDVTLKELKDYAQGLAQITGRDTIKAIIGKFADKLSEVAPGDYQALYDNLSAIDPSTGK